MSWYFIAFFVAVGHALRAPIAPALPGYPKSRLLGVLPSFRRDAAGCLAAHASYCRREGLDAVALNMGLLGTFTLVVGAEQVASVFEDRESVMFKSAIDRRGVGLLTGIGVLLADGKEHTRKRRLVLPSFDARRLTAYVETMSDISKQVADELLGAADAAPPGGAATFEASNTMSSAALRIVGLCLFSSDPAGGSDAATKDFGSALEECLEHTAWISRSALPPPKWLPRTHTGSPPPTVTTPGCTPSTTLPSRNSTIASELRASTPSVSTATLTNPTSTPRPRGPPSRRGPWRCRRRRRSRRAPT